MNNYNDMVKSYTLIVIWKSMENWRLFNLLTIYNNGVCCHTLSSWVYHSNLISSIVHYRLDGVTNQSGCGGRSFNATMGDDNVLCVVH